MTVRAAVIGLGVGRKHALVYAGHPQCELVGLCDFDPEKVEAARREFPQVRATANAEDVLSDPAIDLVSIASYDNYHCAQVVSALEAGKHVFVEKPLCLNAQELQAIRSALDAHPKLRLSCNLVLRTVPRFNAVKRLLAEGRFGRLFYAEADYLYGRLGKITEGWRGKLDFYSVVLGGAIHVVDLLLWLTGDEVIEVSAMGNRIASTGSGFHYDDMVAALLKFKSGLIAKVSANFGCVFPHFHNVVLYGTEATFVNGLTEGSLVTSRTPGAEAVKITDDYPGRDQAALLQGFIGALTGAGGGAYVAADDAFRAMSVCLAIDEAATSGATVKVRYI